MEKKITKKEMFERLIEIVERASISVEDTNMLRDFLDAQIALVAKKSGTKTKTEIEHEKLVEAVYEALVEINEPVTATEMLARIDIEGISSNQKLSSLLKKLVDCGRVIKTSDKKRSYFSVNAE